MWPEGIRGILPVLAFLGVQLLLWWEIRRGVRAQDRLLEELRRAAGLPDSQPAPVRPEWVRRTVCWLIILTVLGLAFFGAHAALQHRIRCIEQKAAEIRQEARDLTAMYRSLRELPPAWKYFSSFRLDEPASPTPTP